MESQTLSSSPSVHVLIFPFFSKGHTIPVLHLARLLLLRHPNVDITIITTPANHSFIAEYLADTTAFIIDLIFPENIPEIPFGVESTDQLPSISLFLPFVEATKLMQPAFERALQSLAPVSFMISDGFLWWTVESALKFGFPRLVFYGFNNYSMSVSKIVFANRLFCGRESDDQSITLTQFPWIEVTANDFVPMFIHPELHIPEVEFAIKHLGSTSKSYGLIVNSFYELEPAFVDYWNREEKPKAWCVGPLCLAEPPRSSKHQTLQKPTWIQWLDQMHDQGCPVLYVAFGTQVEMSSEQLKELTIGLVESKVNFLWLIRKEEPELVEGFEGRGIIVREWVDQTEILLHQSIQGFLSHCGWNSVMESICAGVPILALPMMAEQPLNAKMVAEEMKVGLRLEKCDGLVKSEEIKKMVKELMEGEKGKAVRKKVKDLSNIAKKSMEEEKGSSWKTLDRLINEASKATCTRRNSTVDV